MTPAAGPIGYFGKIPSKGDFVAEHLPASFIEPWDAWLRLTLAHCRERLGDAAREAFLSSPVWRFVLAGGVCGKQAWAGVVASSVDRVGRTYPLTLAAGMPPDSPLETLPERWAAGFERLIDLALMMLRDEDEVAQAAALLAQLLEQAPIAAAPAAPALAATAPPLEPGDALFIAGPDFEQRRSTGLAQAGSRFSLMWQADWGERPQAIIGHGLPDTSRCLTLWEAPQAG